MLAEPRLTEDLQNAYDGSLPLWGDRLTTSPRRRVLGSGSTGVGARSRLLCASRPAPSGSKPICRRGTLRPGTAAAPGRHRVGPPGWPGRSGRRCAGPHAPAGDNLELIVVWRALGASAVSYTLFVQAVDDQGGKVGQLDRLPCGGECPTSGWHPGDFIGERLLLPIRPEAQPGSYRLILGMYDLQTGQRLPVLDARGEAVGDSCLWALLQSGNRLPAHPCTKA